MCSRFSIARSFAAPFFRGSEHRMLAQSLMPPATHPIAIHKFGGAALAGASAIAHVGALLAKPSDERRVVVTSALQGVTDSLLRAVHCATEGNSRDADTIARELTQRHASVADALVAGEERIAVEGALAALAG